MEKKVILNRIITLCTEKRSFNDLAENLDGLDPITIAEYLSELERAKELKMFEGCWVKYNFKRRPQKTLSEDDSLKRNPLGIPYFSFHKKPHPLDYEWRNSHETLDILCDLIDSTNEKSCGIMMLGMPGLFMSAYHRNLRQEITLIDKNGLLLSELKKITASLSNLKIIQSDIFDIEPSELKKVNAIFIDPPWYSSHFMGFIWFAAQSLEIGGYLAISLPQLNTRPGISIEREKWFSYCTSLGLDLEKLEARKMEYIMPFFEFNAFRAAGISGLLPFWRKGDLAIFRKSRHSIISRPDSKKLHADWDEVEIKGVRIRVKNEAAIGTEFAINHLVAGDILPAVSSRDPRRQKANIWTSGNRIFTTSSPAVFLENTKMYALSEGVEDYEYQLSKQYLDYIVEIENKEYKNYLDWITYELEKRNASRTGKWLKE